MPESNNLEKFKIDDSGRHFIRNEFFNGKNVAFGIAGIDLSVLGPSDFLKLNTESDNILSKIRENSYKRFFEYSLDFGFIEVNKPNWFIL